MKNDKQFMPYKKSEEVLAAFHAIQAKIDPLKVFSKGTTYTPQFMKEDAVETIKDWHSQKKTKSPFSPKSIPKWKNIFPAVENIFTAQQNEFQTKYPSTPHNPLDNYHWRFTGGSEFPAFSFIGFTLSATIIL